MLPQRSLSGPGHSKPLFQFPYTSSCSLKWRVPISPWSPKLCKAIVLVDPDKSAQLSDVIPPVLQEFDSDTEHISREDITTLCKTLHNWLQMAPRCSVTSTNSFHTWGMFGARVCGLVWTQILNLNHFHIYLFIIVFEVSASTLFSRFGLNFPSTILSFQITGTFYGFKIYICLGCNRDKESSECTSLFLMASNDAKKSEICVKSLKICLVLYNYF